jgi:hypothetical protein
MEKEKYLLELTLELTLQRAIRLLAAAPKVVLE